MLSTAFSCHLQTYESLVRTIQYPVTTSHKKTFFHQFGIYHVGTQSSSANYHYASLMRPDKVKTAVHGCWLLSSIFIFGQRVLIHSTMHAYGFNMRCLHVDFASLLADLACLTSGFRCVHVFLRK